MINPYDLGEIVESMQKVNIDDIVQKAVEAYKIQFIKSTLELNGVEVQLSSTKTRFGGNRQWFVCPRCRERRGVLYLNESNLACRLCLNLKYKKQRFKGMLEMGY